jgi:hypothetical protein
MIDKIFELCVDVLVWMAAKLHISYQAINVWIFCIIWPLITIGLIIAVVVLLAKH